MWELLLESANWRYFLTERMASGDKMTDKKNLNFAGLTKGEKFIVEWRYNLGCEFHSALIEAIIKANDENKNKLRQVFPDEVAAIYNFYNITDWWQKIHDKINTPLH